MKIVVCAKQVPGSNEVKMDPVTHTIVREAKEAVTNPFDSHAIALAARLKAEWGAQATALSMGIPATGRLLRDAASRGIDRCVLLTDPAFAGADTLATAYTLALGVRAAGGADLILCGKMAVDGDTAQIGPELAEWLGIPHLTEVCAVEALEDGWLTVWRQVDGGARQQLRVRLPAVLAVTKEAAFPDMPSIAGVRQGMAAPLETFSADELKADRSRIGLDGSPTQVVRTFIPQRRAAAVAIEGTVDEQVEKLAALLREGVG